MLTEAQRQDLQQRFGARLSLSASVREAHGRDESFYPPAPPDAVLMAETEAEVLAAVAWCHRECVPLIPFEQVDRIHLTVDGADEAGPGGVLIKGGGAALLREKIIANASDHMVVIADPTKDVQSIGAFPLPVEVTPFGYTITAKKVHDALVAAGVERPRVELRKAPRSAELLVTDGGNYILDCHCGLIPDPPKAAAFLSGTPGVVEHGLFIGIARTVIFGTETGARIIEY